MQLAQTYTKTHAHTHENMHRGTLCRALAHEVDGLASSLTPFLELLEHVLSVHVVTSLDEHLLAGDVARNVNNALLLLQNAGHGARAALAGHASLELNDLRHVENV
eukprot:GDKI01028359.1.p1 GENE.GDKI01028359.1~~GDKI01028359.1.p1  ORF type:complete len:106 (-),score=20.45 GDKI01028359.1:40-357(-)